MSAGLIYLAILLIGDLINLNSWFTKHVKCLAALLVFISSVVTIFGKKAR